MSARAGIVITGTEVLTGIISDRNGPWLSERLREIGVDVAHITVVGDRPDDMHAALRFLAGEGVDVVVTSGGLGPTADDLTAEVVAAFQERALALDAALEERIADILRPLAKRWPSLDMEAVRRSNRKQALVPDGATVLDPVGTAPGLVVPPGAKTGRDAPTVVVLPGPPRELQPMWRAALATDALRGALSGATTYRNDVLRLFGIPESEIAASLLAIEEGGLALDALEITTCLRRGEIEIATRYEPGAADVYEQFAAAIAERHAGTLFSTDAATIDQQVAALLRGPPLSTLAVAESCTGGLLAGRITDTAGASDYFLGGVVVYGNQAKTELVGVDPSLIEHHGAVSSEVAEALADGARARFGADVGAGVTGVAGPGGGTEDKPVGRVCFSVSTPDARLTRELDLPGGRVDVRDRSTTVALHLLRRLLRGEAPPAAPS